MENIVDFSKNFMHIAEVMVINSNNDLRIAYKEKSESNVRDEEAGHFLKLKEKRVGKDIEVYGQMSLTDKLGYGLPVFLLLLFNIRSECPESYRMGSPILKELGDSVYEGKILENWDRLFLLNP